MEGLFISKEKKAISQISQPSFELSLLAAGGELEIVAYDISVDKPCNICPGEKPGLLEFYYVLEGMAVLKLDGREVVLEKGEYFYVQDLKEIINFTTRNGARLLYVTSQPMFEYLRDYHEGLGKLLEETAANDPYTYSHCNRVQAFALKIGEKMGLMNREMYTLQVASLFHDVGKHRVPESILKKPGKLTGEEFERIKRHSADSLDLLKGKFEDRILTAVEQHHERLDGSGYPRGLKGCEIMQEARIIAVADAYDAMTTERSYKKAMSPESALEELGSLKQQYDETVVEALREALEEDGVIQAYDMMSQR